MPEDRLIIKKGQVKAFAGEDWHVSVDFYPALDERVKRLISDAKARAIQEKKNTLLVRHL